MRFFLKPGSRQGGHRPPYNITNYECHHGRRYPLCNYDFGKHLDYIHFNPVKHGYADRVRVWPYSTFHRYVRSGVSPIAWAGSAAITNDGVFGELSALMIWWAMPTLQLLGRNHGQVYIDRSAFSELGIHCDPSVVAFYDTENRCVNMVNVPKVINGENVPKSPQLVSVQK